MTKKTHSSPKSNPASPLVSIIVPTFNRRNFLPLTLQSILHQTYGRVQAVVVNDYGEPVEDIIKAFNDARLKLINHYENQGLAAARNTGMKNSDGNYFIFLDDDDTLYAEAVEFRLNLIQKYMAEIVYTHVLKAILDRARLSDGREVYHITERVLYWHSDYDPDLILIQNISPCNGVMFSRKAWDASGNYQLDTSLTSTEDHDMWCALSRHYPFFQSKVIDCECTFRKDGSQMTGTRNFVPNWIKMFKRWRNTAQNLEYVTNAQNEILRRVDVNPADHGL